METKKMQQPLLYIQQPDFENLTAPMQQYFISKKPIKEQSDVQDIEDTIQNHETDDPKVMEFILEGILSTKEDEDLTENVSNRIAPIGKEANTTIELRRKKKVSSEEVETEKEDTEQSPSESNSNEKKDEKKKKKKKKRTPFNGLSLVDKINELRNLPNSFAKVLYEFVTRENTYRGYLVSYKNDSILIQPKVGKQTIRIPEDQIINIRIIGF